MRPTMLPISQWTEFWINEGMMQTNRLWAWIYLITKTNEKKAWITNTQSRYSAVSRSFLKVAQDRRGGKSIQYDPFHFISNFLFVPSDRCLHPLKVGRWLGFCSHFVSLEDDETYDDPVNAAVALANIIDVDGDRKTLRNIFYRIYLLSSELLRWWVGVGVVLFYCTIDRYNNPIFVQRGLFNFFFQYLNKPNANLLH